MCRGLVVHAFHPGPLAWGKKGRVGSFLRRNAVGSYIICAYLSTFPLFHSPKGAVWRFQFKKKTYWAAHLHTCLCFYLGNKEDPLICPYAILATTSARSPCESFSQINSREFSFTSSLADLKKNHLWALDVMFTKHLHYFGWLDVLETLALDLVPLLHAANMGKY